MKALIIVFQILFVILTSIFLFFDFFAIFFNIILILFLSIISFLYFFFINNYSFNEVLFLINESSLSSNLSSFILILSISLFIIATLKSSRSSKINIY